MQLFSGYHIHLQHPYFISHILHSRIEKLHTIAFFDNAVQHFKIGNDAAERVKHRVEYQRLQRCLVVTHRAWHTFYHSLQNIFNPFTGFSRCADDIFLITSYQFNNFIFHFFGHRTGHVYLIYNRDNLQVMLNRHIQIRDGLCLNALCGIHHQQRTFTRSDASRNFIRKVNVARSVYQIQDVFLSFIYVFHLYGMTFYRDTALFLQLHII